MGPRERKKALESDAAELKFPKWMREILASEMEKRYGKGEPDARKIRDGSHAMTTAIVSLNAMKRVAARITKQRR
jgi:hypothetical protein